jgi:hypothetical protein
MQLLLAVEVKTKRALMLKLLVDYTNKSICEEALLFAKYLRNARRKWTLVSQENLTKKAQPEASLVKKP